MPRTGRVARYPVAGGSPRPEPAARHSPTDSPIRAVIMPMVWLHRPTQAVMIAGELA